MVLGGYLGSTRYSTLPDPPSCTTPGTPLPDPHAEHEDWDGSARGAARRNSAVGLISVDQLSLSAHFSDIRELTEVYNLSEIGRINNHSFIPGNN